MARTWNGHEVPYDLTVEELRTFVECPGPKAWCAFVALGRSPDPRATDILVEKASASDWRFRRGALEALAERPMTDRVASAIRAGLGDSNEYVVESALLTAAKTQLRDLHDAIVPLLESRSATIRALAVGALRYDGQDEVFEELVLLFTRDQSPGPHRAAARVLQEDGG